MLNRRLPKAAIGLALALIAAGAAGCGNKTVTPTPVLTTENFTGTLAVLGSDSKRFTVAYTADISDASITVTNLTTVSTGTPLAVTIGVAFGTPAFDGSCTPSASFTANSATINQELVASGVFIGPNTYCVRIFDNGTLTEPTNYALTVKHY
jgi:hypothetical protein